MSDGKDSDERYHIYQNDEDIVTNDIEKNTDNIEKESDEGNLMDITDGKQSDERDQIGESI